MLSICYRNVVPKVRVELTRGHPHRFLSATLVVASHTERKFSLDSPSDTPHKRPSNSSRVTWGANLRARASSSAESTLVMG